MSESTPDETNKPAPLRWHYGPTDTDPEPGKMWCYDCAAEVWFIEGGAICSGCGRVETDEPQPEPEAEPEDPAAVLAREQARLDAEVERLKAKEVEQAEQEKRPLFDVVERVEQILKERAANPDPRLAERLAAEFPAYDTPAEAQAAARQRAWRNDLTAADHAALANWTVERLAADQHPDVIGKYVETVGHADARVLNLVLAGRVGPGKTSAAIAAGNLAAAAGHTVRFVKHTTYLRWLRPDQSPEGLTPERIRERYRRCALLILDDFGAGLATTEEASEFVQRETEDLIGDRLTAGRHTILTTNLTSEQLAVMLGPRAISRVGARAYAARFEGPDRRKPVTW